MVQNEKSRLQKSVMIQNTDIDVPTTSIPFVFKTSRTSFKVGDGNESGENALAFITVFVVIGSTN